MRSETVAAMKQEKHHPSSPVSAAWSSKKIKPSGSELWKESIEEFSLTRATGTRNRHSPRSSRDGGRGGSHGVHRGGSRRTSVEAHFANDRSPTHRS